MITPGTNCITKAEDIIRTMISECTSFQTWTSSANAAEALERVHPHCMNAPTGNKREYEPHEWQAMFPLALLEEPEDGDQAEFNVTSHGLTWAYSSALRFDIALFRFRDHSIEERDDVRNLRNSVGDIFEEFKGKIGDGGFGATTLTVGGMVEPKETLTALVGEGKLIGWKWLIVKDDS